MTHFFLVSGLSTLYFALQRYNFLGRYAIKKAFFDAESRKKVIFLRKVKKTGSKTCVYGKFFVLLHPNYGETIQNPIHNENLRQDDGRVNPT